MLLNYKFWATVLSATALITGCQKSEQQTPAASAPTTASSTKKVYRVATDATYPPFEFTTEKGDIVGFDIDLLNAIAADQNFEVKYYHHFWEGMFDELQNNHADILASAIAITDEAKEKAILSTGYCISPYAVVSLKPELIQNDDAWKSKKIAVSVNDDAGQYLMKEFSIPSKQLYNTDSVYLTLTELMKNHAEVASGDATVMRYRINSPTFTAANVKFHIKNLKSNNIESDTLVFAVAKNNQELLNRINAGLEHVKQTGQLDALLKKWHIHLEGQ